MATKTISITEDAYGRLAAMKDMHESFSDVILRTTKKVPLSSFAGALSSDTINKLEKRIKGLRNLSAHRASRIAMQMQK